MRIEIAAQFSSIIINERVSKDAIIRFLLVNVKTCKINYDISKITLHRYLFAMLML